MDLDWRWLRSFVAVASAGTMKEAASASGISQPTLSRHIKLLEDELDMTLFEHSRFPTMTVTMRHARLRETGGSGADVGF